MTGGAGSPGGLRGRITRGAGGTVPDQAGQPAETLLPVGRRAQAAASGRLDQAFAGLGASSWMNFRARRTRA
jgi:hypothetical protein